MIIDPAVAAAIGGAILGAAVAGVATSLIELWKYKAETRTDAYKSFIETSSQIATFTGMLGPAGVRGLSAAQQDKFIGLLMQFRTAKAKVALYGSPAVLAKLGAFTASHARLESDADAEAYIAFITAMRKDSFAKDYAAYGADVDRLMVRDEMQIGPDGRVTTMRERFGALAEAPTSAATPAPTPTAPPPPSPAGGLHGSISFGGTITP